MSARILFSTALTLAAVNLYAQDGDALEEYVKAKDDTFKWKTSSSKKSGGFIEAHLEMTSQTWRTNTWTHHVRIVTPEKIRNPQIAFVFVTGDGTGSSTLPMLRTLAERAGALAAVVTRVPNQPLYGNRVEDALIAYTFGKYMETSDRTWPLLFPMVKSAVRAMDTVQQYAKKEHKIQVKEFVVAGASKRGWTTWLTAAVDQRVSGIAPMVIDVLNMPAQLDWAKKVYGKQSEQISDYTEMGFDKQMNNPKMVELRKWVDPYSYRNRYKIPKLILLGTNDRYWTVDAQRHYYQDLPEPKLIFQTPNAGHDLNGGNEAIQTLAAFFQIIADKEPLPSMQWNISETVNGATNATIEIRLNKPAQKFTLWTADSVDRDLRDEKWNSKEVSSESKTKATLKVQPVETGYRAYLGEATLKASTGHNYRLSTEARVLPDLKLEAAGSK